jgi:hypothetical protein
VGNYNAFVVRVWSDTEERLHGIIQHADSLEEFVFMDPEEIVQFIINHINVESEGTSSDKNVQKYLNKKSIRLSDHP